MLVITRRVNEKIVIGDPRSPIATITVARIIGDRVRIGVDADASVQIHREEIARVRAASDEIQIVRDSIDASAGIPVELLAIARGEIPQTAELVGYGEPSCEQAGEILTAGAANRQSSPGSGDDVTDRASDDRQHPTGGSERDSQATTSERLDESSIGGA